jgi:hypothetical protein
MLDQIMAGYGQKPDAAGKINQKPLAISGSAHADQVLLPALAETDRFMDQEF